MSKSKKVQASPSVRAGAQAETKIQSCPAAPAARGGSSGSGAAPSNTAPANYKEGHTSLIRSGVDSLYLSWPGSAFQDMSERLSTLKTLAQSPDQADRSGAILGLLDHWFEVSDKGRGRFAFVLSDHWFTFGVSRPTAQAIPLAIAQVGSELLNKSGWQAAVDRANNLVSYLGASESHKVSRVDLCVDFLTEFDVSRIPQEAWITRAAAIDTHSVKRKFSGWSIGYGGDIKCRLYNKTLEIEKSGKTFLYELWQAAGWEGEYPVWRLEFEFRRSVLKSLGIEATADFDEKLNGLWQYAMQEWLRLTIPMESDSQKTRWPEHPMWTKLRQARFGDGVFKPLSRTRKERLPSDEFLFVNGLGAITSFMAREGISDLADGAKAFLRLASRHHRNRRESGYSFDSYVNRKVSEKIRKFNTRPASAPKDKSAAENGKAEEGE